MNATLPEKVYYPDSDGQPLVHNSQLAEEVAWLKAYFAHRFANDRAIVFDTYKPDDSFGKFWRRRESYHRDGVEEWYIWDERWEELIILYRSASSESLRSVEDEEWVSPKTGITFVNVGDQEWKTYRPLISHL